MMSRLGIKRDGGGDSDSSRRVEMFLLVFFVSNAIAAGELCQTDL